jgi:hypothetical protein
VAFVLAILTVRLRRRVLGAADAPLGAVMYTRGAAGAAAGPVATGPGSSSGATTVAALASETPNRCARAVREQAGASPKIVINSFEPDIEQPYSGEI